MKIYSTILANNNTQRRLRYNGDTGTNYKSRFSINGAADTDEAASSAGIVVGTTSDNPVSMAVLDVVNIANKEKISVGQVVQSGTAGAANATGKLEITAKWANTSAQISQIDLIGSTDGLAAGTEIIVYGKD